MQPFNRIDDGQKLMLASLLAKQKGPDLIHLKSIDLSHRRCDAA